MSTRRRNVNGAQDQDTAPTPKKIVDKNGLKYDVEDELNWPRVGKALILTLIAVGVIVFLFYSLTMTGLAVYDGERNAMDAIVWDLLPLFIESIASYYFISFLNKIMLLNDDKFNTPEDLKKYE